MCNSQVQHGVQKHVLFMVVTQRTIPVQHKGRNRSGNLDISGSRKTCKYTSSWRNSKVQVLKDLPGRGSTGCSHGERWPTLFHGRLHCVACNRRQVKIELVRQFFNGRLHCVACNRRQVKSDAEADPPPVSMAPTTLRG